MDDSEIVELYWERSENAIAETSKKYSRYCRYISYNILHNNEEPFIDPNDIGSRVKDSDTLDSFSGAKESTVEKPDADKGSSVSSSLTETDGNDTEIK